MYKVVSAEKHTPHVVSKKFFLTHRPYGGYHQLKSSLGFLL
jgi:hypothetical protein